MTFIVCCLALAPAIFAAGLASRVIRRREAARIDRAIATADMPGITGQRIPGAALADADDRATVTEADPEPGDPGEYPEYLPPPGALSGTDRDVEDLLTGAIRYLREMAR